MCHRNGLSRTFTWVELPHPYHGLIFVLKGKQKQQCKDSGWLFLGRGSAVLWGAICLVTFDLQSFHNKTIMCMYACWSLLRLTLLRMREDILLQKDVSNSCGDSESITKLLCQEGIHQCSNLEEYNATQEHSSGYKIHNLWSWIKHTDGLEVRVLRCRAVEGWFGFQ